MRLLRYLLPLLLAAQPALPQLMGAGPGHWAPPAGGGGYVGLGDLAVTDSFTVLGYWGLMAYKAATATTANMASICDSAGANCTIMKGNSNGTLNLTTLTGGHNCVSSADCTITTLYGGVGTEGNMAPTGSKPFLSASGIFGLSKPVMYCGPSTGLPIQTMTAISGSIPATYVVVAAIDGSTGFTAVISDGSYFGEGIFTGANGTVMYVGGNAANFAGSAMAASKWYAMVAVGNTGGGTSRTNANGTSATTTTDLGASWGGAGGWAACKNGWTGNGGAYIGALAVLAGDQTSHITDILNNLKTAWGFTYP